MKPEEIQKLRKKLGYTQVDLADMVGVSSITVSRWENGRSEPSPLAVKALSFLSETLGKKRRT